VITDLVMPVRGGSELIKYIFDNHPEITVIIITAYPSTDSAIHAVKSGVFDYFTKPFKTEDMLSTVKKALERNKEVPFMWDRLTAYNVTKRETGLLRLVIEDGIAENKEIAEKLSIKVTTVKQHFENLYNKFGTNNRASLISAVIKALRN
jgi:DNA-binding NarL/FixJ family response regulator